MKITESCAASGFQRLKELRLLILRVRELRIAAALGLKIPPPPIHGQSRRDDTATRSP